MSEPQRAPVAHSSAQDTAQHVITPIVAGQDAIGDGKGERANVVGDDAEGDALPQGVFLLRSGILRIKVGVGMTGNLLELGKKGTKDIRAVVGDAL